MSRKLLIIFGGAIILLAVVILVVLFLQRRTIPPATNANTSTSVPNVNTVILNSNQQPANANTAVTGGEVDARRAVERIATDFASIYGSFSTQNDFQNITDLYFYMAPPLKAQQEAYVAEQRAKQGDTSLYRGTTSVARITDTEQFDLAAGTAQVKVTLQRVESSGTSNETAPFTQSLTMNFERIQGAWKVARLAWGQKQ
jgi:hypothetical protein